MRRRSKCLQKKEKKLEAAVKELTAIADPYGEIAEAISDLMCIKSNSLKKTSETKQQEIVDINAKI